MKNQTLDQFIAQELKNEAKQLGRKVDPNSERQKRLTELAARRESGELRRGRPVSGESERQKRLAEREARVAAGIEVKRGRPAMLKVTDIVELEKA